MKKFVVFVLILLVSGLIGWQVKQKIDQKQNLSMKRRGKMAVAVEIEPINRRTIRRTSEFSGTLLPMSRSVIAPKVAGRLEKIAVNIGSPVKKGDLIAVLDSEEYTHQVDQVEAELDVTSAGLREADSALAVARKDYERKAKLHQREVISTSEFEATEAKYQAALASRNEVLAQIKQRKAAIKTARTIQSYTEIYAHWENGPEERFVSERFADEGTMLKANDSLVAIVDISRVIGVINVIERDYPRIDIGRTAVIYTDAYPGRSFEGRVVRKSPVLKETTRQARVEIEIPNPDHALAPGMFIRAEIRFEEHADAVVVPIEALATRKGEQGVFIADLKENKARFVPITTGIVNPDEVEVTAPELNDPVITLGHHLLVDGTTIMLPGDRKKPEGRPGAPKKSPSGKPTGKPDGKSGGKQGGKPAGGQS